MDFKLVWVAAILVVVIYAVYKVMQKHVETLPAKLDFGRKKDYVYRLKEEVFSKAEARCFRILDETFSKKFYVVPKMALNTILDGEIKGQNWDGAARAIIDLKVDFMMIHRKTLTPICAVQLDDRIEGNFMMEQILGDVGFPIVKLKRPEEMSKKEIVLSFAKVLKKYYD